MWSQFYSLDFLAVTELKNTPLVRVSLNLILDLGRYGVDEGIVVHCCMLQSVFDFLDC